MHLLMANLVASCTFHPRSQAAFAHLKFCGIFVGGMCLQWTFRRKQKTATENCERADLSLRMYAV